MIALPVYGHYFVMARRTLFQVVVVGRRPGIYVNNCHLVNSLTMGVPDALVVECQDLRHAREIFTACLNKGLVVQYTHIDLRKMLNEFNLEEIPGFREGSVKPGFASYVAVYVGREPGVFSTQSNIDDNVRDIAQARVDNFYSVDKARAAFLVKLREQEVVRVVLISERRVLGVADI